MNKIAFLTLIIIIFTSCSLDTESGIWNKKINKKKLSKVDINDLDKDISFNQYKDIVTEYGKYSEFPDINN
jgi:hypothetical protein|tara:strand:- start:3812 stop:4024 length:213 start_codon:yes stop_codon:yes gene_type:complete